MDIKIGRITWDDNEDEWVIRKKDKWPLRKLAGFSILGYMVGTGQFEHNYIICGLFLICNLSKKNTTSLGENEQQHSSAI